MSTTYKVELQLEDEFDERENLHMLESDVAEAVDNTGLRVTKIKAYKLED